MSTRIFIISILAIVLSVVGYTFLASNDAALEAEAKKRNLRTGSQYNDPQNQKGKIKSKFSSLLDTTQPWEVRTDSLRNLDKSSLKQEEVDELFKLLKYKPQAKQKETWYVTVNEIMEQMRIHGIGSERYTDTLISIITDPRQDSVVRDYAVQHLAGWLAKRGEASYAHYEKNEEKVNIGIQTLTSVITDPSVQKTTIPGTTLRVLVDIHQSILEKSRIENSFEELAPWLAETISGREDSSLLTRTSAINAVAMMKLTEYLPVIRAIIQAADSDDSAKLTSIAALGNLAETSDLPTLKEIAAGNTKFKHAAYAALTKISKR